MKKLIICILIFASCKKENECKTYTADTYCVPKQSGIIPCSNGTVTFKDCNNHTSGEVILYNEDAYMKYYRKIK
jgi:hypothetical protein